MSVHVAHPPIDTSSAPRPLAEVQRWLDGPHELVVEGAVVPTADRLTSIDPATGAALAEVAGAGADGVDRAVAAARRAVADRRWAGIHPDARATALLRIAALIEAHAAELAQIETLDVGKPLAQAQADVAVAAGVFRYYAGWTTKAHGTTNPTPDNRLSLTVREPHGVCAGIVPWNYPIIMAALKVAPAIAFGNTAVLKPAEQTPLTALRLGELCAEAELPAGVVTVVPGLGPAAGQALVDHPGVDHVSFTGSTEVGRAVMAGASARINPVALELGGKSATVVFPDADLDAVVEGVSRGIWTNAGQWCVAGTRLVVAREVADEVVDRLATAAAGLRLGHGLDPATDVGPLVSDEQRRRVLGYLGDATGNGNGAGGHAVVGGRAVDGPGYFVEPTILAGVERHDRCAQEEIFGPVLVVLPVDDEAEAVAVANCTRYGLAAGVWTSDLARAHRVARQVNAGMVWVNMYGEFDYGTSYGGYAESGFGRELGPYSVDVYTQTKSILVALP
ncbi:MAG TPA: aldehyde dehydrogenase family protein [Acidimicrobiales bacterium]|nr:aldehyde dehydrogenase family protein [Acidimicrobiales bacterium]